MIKYLTKITTPFGLLEAKTQEQLRTWPHGLLVLDHSANWVSCDTPTWLGNSVYRAKPAPREYVAWLVCSPDGRVCGSPWLTEKIAQEGAATVGGFVVKLTGVRDE